MPNWCNITLIVTNGDPKAFFESVRTEDSVFDFNTLLPMPADIGDRMVVDKSGFTLPEWYVWSSEHWGTKWNACDARHSTQDPDTTIWFDTAWSPPVPIFEALAKKFPEHEFTIHADECGTHIHETYTVKEGDLTGVSNGCSCFSDCKSDGNVTLTGEEGDTLGIEEPSD